jgi:hypothetical protein
MSDFSKENFNPNDYPGLVDTWCRELARAGWTRTWNDGPAYCPPDEPLAEGLCLSEAYAQMSGDPTDWELGIERDNGSEKEPRAPTYRKPV